MSLAETYDRIAEFWHADHQTDDWWQEGTDRFISFLPQGASVLDVGCGSGVKSKYLRARELAAVGIDISENLLAIARRESPDGDFRKLSMLELEQVPETFDGVFAQASLLHIAKADAPTAVRKMAGRAKPGGFVYVAVKEARPDQPEERIEKESDYGFEYERFFSYFSMEELKRYFSDAGLETVFEDRKSSPSGKTVWLQIIGKK